MRAGVRMQTGFALALAGVIATAGSAAASHNGPTRAEVLGLDARRGRIYFAQFDESEVAYAPRLFYFDLRARDPRIAVQVPGPLYDGDEDTPRFEARIDSLRRALARPVAADTASFALRLEASPLADSVIGSGDAEERAARFELRGELSGAGLRGGFRGTSFFEAYADKISAWRFPSAGVGVVIVSWPGVWIGSGDEFETCVLLTRGNAHGERSAR